MSLNPDGTLLEPDVSRTPSDATEQQEWLFRLLERLASGAGVAFDRIHNKRVFQETLASLPGSVDARWSEWLTSAGRKLGLRVTPVKLPLSDILGLLRPNDPIAIFQPSSSRPSWVLLESSLWTVRAWNGDDVALTRGRLVRALGLSSRRDEVEAVLVQPIAPCEGAATAGHADSSHAHETTTPLARFGSFFRPEWSDIRVVLIFGVFVGLFSLATPLAVESLVTTVMFGNLLQPLLVLSATLLVFLAGSAAMRGTQMVVMEILQRRIFVRVVDDFAFRLPRTPVNVFKSQYAPELVNRFFETVTLQKLGAFLILDGSTIAIQMVVGMTVLAFYHPWLIGFDVFLLSMLSAAVFLFGRGATAAAILESRAKYATVAWLQDVARCSTTFRGAGAADFAFDRADRLATDYISKRDAHFSILFRQIVFVLVLEVLLSTVLLGLGGWLVIQGQLTLGQLVAAELIVSMIVSSIAKLGKHIESYYDLMAGMDKLGHVFDLPMESSEGRSPSRSARGASIELVDVTSGSGADVQELPIHLRIASGERVAVGDGPARFGSIVGDLLLGFRRPASGYGSIDGVDLREISVEALRREAALVRDIEVFEGTIEENVHVGRPEVTALEVQRGLEAAGLWERVRGLRDGVKTRLTAGHGHPLSEAELRQLMLARAFAGFPRLLIVDHGLDALGSQVLQGISDRLVRLGESCTVVLATERDELASCATRRIDPFPRSLPAFGQGSQRSES